MINSDAYYDEPCLTLQRIREAMVDRGATGLPRRTPAGWTRQFIKLPPTKLATGGVFTPRPVTDER